MTQSVPPLPVATMSRHEARAFAILEVVAPGCVLEIEQTLPRKSRHVDGLLFFEQSNPAFGPWADRLADRIVVFEAYSRPPRSEQLATAWLKLAWVSERWVAEDVQLSRGGRPPMLLVVSNGRPRTALRLFDVVVPQSTLGAWATDGEGVFGTLVLDLRTLPAAAGLSVLRFLRFPTSREEARERTACLLGDEHLPITMRRALMDAIMSDQIPIDVDERESAWDRAVRSGVEIGEQRGERRTLLAIARLRASADLVAELEAVDDLDVLRQRVIALVRPE